MKSLLGRMQEILAIWLILLLAGSSCAVFYTKSTDNDYPRIGRRGAYSMNGKPNYAQFGTPGLENDLDLKGSHVNDAFLANLELDGNDFVLNKKGFFTRGNVGLRRQGRTGNEATSSKMLSGSDASSIDVPLALIAEDEVLPDLPLGFLFLELDKDGDAQLSRAEFVAGMLRAREYRIHCQ